MKKGWLVVNYFVTAEKFYELYDWLKKSAMQADIELCLKTNAELMFEINTKQFLKENTVLPDFVLFWDKDIFLAKSLEGMGLRLFNSSKAIEVCDDKALTHSVLSSAKISQPKTIVAPKTFSGLGYNNLDFLEIVENKLDYPFVIKERSGSFGKQVYLAKNRQEAQAIISQINHKPFLFQELIKTSIGKDIRVNVVGGNVVASMIRQSTTNDFRSNLTLGGTAENYTLNDIQKNAVQKACNIIGTDFAGVDILFGINDEPLICEVNSNAHFKTTFQYTGVNVADEIIAHISSQV